MSPLIPVSDTDPDTGLSMKYKTPLVVWYTTKFQKLLSGNSEAILKHKKELFGPSHEDESPNVLSHYAMLRTLGITEDDFDLLDIHTRAKIIAEYTLNGMIELRSRHLSILEQNLEKAKSKRNKPNGKGS